MPREIERRALTRMFKLGEGNYGEVWKYSLDEPGRGVPAYMVAVKTLKSAESTDDLRKLLLNLLKAVKNLPL